MKGNKAMKKHLLKYGSKLRRAVAPLAAGVGALVVAPYAMAAGGGLGADALAAITSLEGDVQAVLAVLVGVVFLLVLFAYLKRAK